jgi:hypothetical protein
MLPQDADIRTERISCGNPVVMMALFEGDSRWPGCTTTGVKLKKQDLTLASKVGLLQGKRWACSRESGRTPRRLRTAGF